MIDEEHSIFENPIRLVYANETLAWLDKFDLEMGSDVGIEFKCGFITEPELVFILYKIKKLKKKYKKLRDKQELNQPKSNNGGDNGN